MNWDAIGAIGEILGAAAVVVSLIYLASQIRLSNMQAQGDAYSQWMTTFNDTIKGWVKDRETVQVMQNGFTDFAALSKVDQAIFAQQIAALINHWSLAVELAERKLITEQLVKTATEVTVSVCSTSGGRQYFESNYVAYPRGPQLLELVNAEESVLPPWDVVAPWWSVEATGSQE